MTDREKLEKLKKLADAMFYAAQQLTTDASRLHKAMDEYHKFIIHECKEEQASEKKCMYSKDNYTDEDRKALCDGCEEECIEKMNEERKRDLSLWSLGDFENKFFEIIKPYKDSRNYKNLCIRLVVWRSELWRWIHWKKRKEEPVSEIDFEQELYKYFGQVKDFTLGMRIAKRFYDIGRNYQKPVSEDLEQAIDTYLATYFGGEKEKQDWPFLKKMAIYFAKWQKQQDQSTIELAEDHAMLAGMEKMKEEMMAKAVDGDITFDYYGDDDKTYGCIAHDSFCLEDFGLKDMDKVKIIVIKKN